MSITLAIVNTFPDANKQLNKNSNEKCVFYMSAATNKTGIRTIESNSCVCLMQEVLEKLVQNSKMPIKEKTNGHEETLFSVCIYGEENDFSKKSTGDHYKEHLYLRENRRMKLNNLLQSAMKIKWETVKKYVAIYYYKEEGAEYAIANFEFDGIKVKIVSLSYNKKNHPGEQFNVKTTVWKRKAKELCMTEEQTIQYFNRDSTFFASKIRKNEEMAVVSISYSVKRKFDSEEMPSKKYQCRILWANDEQKLQVIGF